MNQNQRKYALQRLNEISSRKANELQMAFMNNPENRAVHIPAPSYPSNGEILRALLGLPSAAELLPREEILRITSTLSQQSSVYINTFAKPTNVGAVEAAKAINAAIQLRQKTEVTDRIANIQATARRHQDVIMLGNDQEALAAIAAFENFGG